MPSRVATVALASLAAVEALQMPAMRTVAPARVPAIVAVEQKEMNDMSNVGLDGLMEAMEDAEATVGGASSEPKSFFEYTKLAGVAEPLSFFDPLEFCTGASEGKVRFYREVELKHGRVAMLAALGFLVAEPFHPLFGGEIGGPAIFAFQQTPLQTFWPAVVLAIAVLEVGSVFSFKEPTTELWSIKSEHNAGDFGFDPMGLKPAGEMEFKSMQTRELNNGRLAMIAAAGMIGQELASGKTLF